MTLHIEKSGISKWRYPVDSRKRVSLWLADRGGKVSRSRQSGRHKVREERLRTELRGIGQEELVDDLKGQLLGKDGSSD